MSSTPIEPTAGSADSDRAVSAKRGETPQEYTRRILGYAEGKDALAVLGATGNRLRTMVRTNPLTALRRRPAPGKWSPVEIIAHLADAEIVASYRLRMIVAHDGIAIQAFDQNEWAANLRYDAIDPEESVELFDVTRTANLRLLRRIDPSRHENYGMHAERGRETVSHLIRLYAGHDLNHLGQLERILGQG
jgi:DinB superfamily